MPIEIRKVLGQGSYEAFLSGEGVQFGFGLFETIRLDLKEDGRWVLHNLEGHFSRLNHSADKLKIALPLEEVMVQAIEDYARDLAMTWSAKVPLNERYWAVKLTVLKTEEKSELLLSHRVNPYPLKAGSDNGLQSLKLKLSELIRDEKSLLTYHKTTNYLSNLLEKRNALADGYDDCFFLNRQGYICETTVANLFFSKGNGMMTPALPCGILPGTARALILKQARAKGIEVEEVELTIEDLKVLDGAVACNALMGAVPIATMDAHHFKGSVQLAQTLSLWIEEAYND